MRLEFRPKYEKIVELLLYLAHKRPNADQCQAVKFLYLADKEHLNKYGRPITFETYFALPFGPVATHALDMLEGDKVTLQQAHIDRLPFDVQTLGKIRFIRAPLRPVNHDLFSKSDLNTFDEVLREHGSKTIDELFQLTHSHFAYRKAWKRRRSGSKREVMDYEDMIDESPSKARVVEELESVASHM
jgi:uncharacterized phage-associated protein